VVVVENKMDDPERLSTLMDEFLEWLYELHEVPWTDVSYVADDYEVPEDWWAQLDEVFPEPML
jgi:hypothetical protein